MTNLMGSEHTCVCYTFIAIETECVSETEIESINGLPTKYQNIYLTGVKQIEVTALS